MLTQDQEVALVKLLEVKKVRRLKEEIQHKEKIIKQLKELIKFMEKGE